MSEVDLQPLHRKFAVEAFNKCWELIEQPGRSREQDLEMIRRAEVSYWHWMQYAEHTVENQGIGCWQLARVYSLAGLPEMALLYAEKYRQLVESNQWDAFHEGYAWEALARAHHAAGRMEDAQRAVSQARLAALRIADPQTRVRLENDLAQLS